MAKTRSQTQTFTIQKEEDDKSKVSHLLRDLSGKSKESSKINKRNASRNDDNLSFFSQVKLEEEDTNKNLLRENKSSDNLTAGMTMKDKLEKFFGYIINDKMTMKSAAIKANIGKATAHRYFMRYKNDPEQNIPVPVVNIRSKNGPIAQEKIKKLIDYIEVEKMSIPAATMKSNISDKTAYKYYRRYKNDPNRNIPVPNANLIHRTASTAQDKIKVLIDHIVNDKMSVVAAAEKVNVDESAAYQYYRLYKNNPEQNIPASSSNKI